MTDGDTSVSAVTKPTGDAHHAAQDALETGRVQDLADLLLTMSPAERIATCRPLVKQANAILSPMFGSTVKSWLSNIDDDYPGGREQFIDAWQGRISTGHWDAATTILIAAKPSPRAAKVWPIPENRAYAEWLYPALFPTDLDVIAEQWSADFATNPKAWDRNRGREVMFEWIERGILPAPAHGGAVLMLLAHVCHAGSWRTALMWLKGHPVVTDQLFRRVFTTPGVPGCSLAQADNSAGSHPIRTRIIPNLLAVGIWTREFVQHEVAEALAMDLPPYQKRWFTQLDAQLSA